jgi:uncharacterized protein
VPERTLPPADNAHESQYRETLARHELVMQRCGACGAVRHPARWICPECWSEDFTWARLSGEGTVHTFVWYMESFDPRFGDVPYNVTVVRLDEGVQVLATVADVSLGDLHVGMRVSAAFRDVAEGFTMLEFRRSQSP